jgi:RimJ/RimL family protein N-acetyltransferase
MLIRGARTVLRAANDDDAPAIVALFDSDHVAAAHGPRFPRSLATTLAELRDPARTTLAIDIDQRLGGFLHSTKSWADDVMTIQEFLIDAEFVGKGYAADALGALLEFFFRRWGGRRAELYVRADNERALRCYRRLGFETEGRKRNVIPPTWGPPGSSDFLLMGMLPGEFRKPS